MRRRRRRRGGGGGVIQSNAVNKGRRSG